MDTPMTRIIMITVTTLMATFHPIMISATFIISKVVIMRLAIGRGDTDLDFLKGTTKAGPFGPAFHGPEEKRIRPDGNPLMQGLKSVPADIFVDIPPQGTVLVQGHSHVGVSKRNA